MKSTTTVHTANASRYLQQLCKHFAHKIETSFTAQSGICRFPHSTVQLNADDDRLHIDVTADSEEALERGRSVIWNHLERFAFRESLAEPKWQTSAGA